MRKAEIDALLLAHAGRARPVAFFHILRQPKLTSDDHAFLLEHAHELGPADLLRWRSRCEADASRVVIGVLAMRAKDNPPVFEHEILGSPRLDLTDRDWAHLESLVEGHVPERVVALVRAKGGERTTRTVEEGYVTPRRLESAQLESEDIPPLELAGPPWDALSTREIFDALGTGRIALDEKGLAALVMSRARSTSEDWSSVVCDFPAGLQDAVVEKARRTTRGNERANLLAWLEAHGASRAALLDLALDRERANASLALMSWVDTQLGSRAAWEKHGPDIVFRLLGQRSYADLADLATLAYSRGKSSPPSIHAAFALAFVRAARESLKVNDPKSAMAVLSALACLDPPSRVSGAVHELRRVPGASAEVLEILAVNERLVKHGSASEASLEAIIAAVHVLVDALE